MLSIKLHEMENRSLMLSLSTGHRPIPQLRTSKRRNWRVATLALNVQDHFEKAKSRACECLDPCCGWFLIMLSLIIIIRSILGGRYRKYLPSVGNLIPSRCKTHGIRIYTGSLRRRTGRDFCPCLVMQLSELLWKWCNDVERFVLSRHEADAPRKIELWKEAMSTRLGCRLWWSNYFVNP